MNVNRFKKRKENGFTLKMTRSRGYPVETTTNADYADYLVLHTNTPAQAESLRNSREQATGSIGFYT